MSVDLGRADVFAAVAAPNRRAMMALLAHQELPVSELAASFAMTLSAVSQNLSVLRQAGLVTSRKEGKQRLYRLDPKPLREIADWLNEYETFWTDKLTDLGTYLQENP